MATRCFNGDAGEAQGLNYTRTVSLFGGSALSNIRTDSVIAYVQMSTNAYTHTYQVRARLLNNSGGVLAEVTRYDIKFDSSNYTGATWEFNFGTGFDQNAIASISFFGLNEASKIFVKGYQRVDVNYTPITVCSAPTAASVTPSLCENDPTLSASGAAGGSANAITGYEIQYAESADGTTYGAWTALKTVWTTGTSLSTTVTLPSVRAYSRKYRLRTLGTAGSSYYSRWVETNAIKRNSLPSAPTSFTAAPEVYVSGAIALTYSGAADPDGNLSTHNIQYATKSGMESWSAWANLTNGITAHTPTLSPGQSIKYRARAVDALGAVSDWLESNACVKNTAPAAPTVNYPQAGQTIYNSRPRLLVTLGADPEGHLQQIISDGFTPSRADGLTAGSKIILRRSGAAASGAVSYSVKSSDQYGEQSTAVTGSLTYSAPNYTDANLTAGTTRIKAAHMNELRTMVNTVRAYYGLAAVVWAETITAGVTKSRGWKAHVIELQQAISDIVTLVNGWDTVSSTNRIAAFTWITPGVKPSAAVMNQIRQVIAWL
jgi:hypothetical protein